VQFCAHFGAEKPVCIDSELISSCAETYHFF